MSDDRAWYPDSSGGGGAGERGGRPPADPWRGQADTWRQQDPWRRPAGGAGAPSHGYERPAAPAPGYEPGYEPPAAPRRRSGTSVPPRGQARGGPAAGAAHGADAGRVNADVDLDEVDAKGRSRSRAAAAAPAKRRSRTRKTIKWTALGMSAVLLAAVGVGGYVYVHFNGNIKAAPLLPPNVTQAPEIPNKFGQTAMNILLIGNSGRLNAADCSLGHACDDSVSTADSMMVLHLSADRSNMTVMSIPRDSIVSLPQCAGGSTNMINSSLANGASCTVQTVINLTGLTIDHFIEVDMAGVVTMSNALGGVPVCVTNNLYDSYSHIKLPKGTSVIQGTQALAWLRTRHAFTNEVDREKAQHMFLAALVRKLKANASFTHITTLYSVANAATKALTVDQSLSTVTDLLSLAQELGKVPADRITFMSVPTNPYTGPNSAWSQQLQFAQPEANAVFASLKRDQPFTAGSAAGSGTKSTSPTAPSTSASPTSAAVDTAQVRAEIRNGSGIGGRAAAVESALESDGFSSSELSLSTASQTSSTTAVYYPEGRSDSAAAVAESLEIPSSALHQSSSYSEVTVVIGKDWSSGTLYTGAGSGGSGAGGAAPTTVASSPPGSSEETNGGNAQDCMTVGHPEW